MNLIMKGSELRMANIFKRGYKAVKEEKARQDEIREQMGKRLFKFFLADDGDEATVRFLTEEPINFNEHNIKSVKGGKERYDSFVCSQDKHCPYCKDNVKTTFKGAFLIYDYTPFEVTDDKGKKKTVKGSVKLYIAGTKVLSQLDRLSSKYGLTSRDYEISRSGKGTSTSYIIERSDEKSELTEKMIEKMLPDSLKDKFDGTEESLYEIVQEQLELLIPHAKSVDDDDHEDDDEEEYKSRKNLIKYDDDDEDSDDEDDDDEEEEEKPKKVIKSAKKSSVKSLFKKN